MDLYNEIFLDRILHYARYTLKEGTVSSYYCQGEDTLLPRRIGMLTGIDMPNCNHSGKQIHRTRTASLKGKYTTKEASPYKQNPPYCITTSLWQSDDFPQFLGWGTIGVSNADGKINARSDTGDLVVVYSPDNNVTLQVYILDGMGKNPDTLAEGLKYITSRIQY